MLEIFCIAVLIIVILALLIGSSDDKPRYEYKSIVLGLSTTDAVERLLNEQAAQGWQLTENVPMGVNEQGTPVNLLIFKRAK
jgi:hypothetical protein